MTRTTALASALGASLALGCSIEQSGGAPLDSGVAASGGSLLGGFGGDGGAAAGSGGASGSPPAGCEPSEQCVPKLPAQWGYAFLSFAEYSKTGPPGPTCPDGAEPQGFFAEPAGNGACEPCACGPIQGGSCSVPLVCGYNSTCASFQSFTQNDGGCKGQTGSPTLSCMLGGATITAPGTCAASGGLPKAVDAWKKQAAFCPTKAAASCGEGLECVPRGSGSYAAEICIYLPGEQTCPGDWPSSAVIYQQALDERKCSACSCQPGAMTCLAEYEFFDDAFCAGSGKTVASSTCTDVSGEINAFWPAWGYKRNKGPTLGGGCTPGGGIASGQIKGDPNTALTVCCRKSG